MLPTLENKSVQQPLLNRPIRSRGLAGFLRVLVLPLALLGGCARPTLQEGSGPTELAPFSGAHPGGPLPHGWQTWVLSRFKRTTEYKLVRDAQGDTVIEASADRAASGLVKLVDVEPTKQLRLQWKWKVPRLIATADNARRDADDSPVRIFVTFDGDFSKLDFEDRAMAVQVKSLTGRDLPYATLMYIWENKLPVDELIAGHHTSRIMMIVAESGIERRGEWIEFQRNIAEDFERAYGEKPGRIRNVGIMTDTDNTGEQVIAYYGDIRLVTQPVASPPAAETKTVIGDTP